MLSIRQQTIFWIIISYIIILGPSGCAPIVYKLYPLDLPKEQIAILVIDLPGIYVNSVDYKPIRYDELSPRRQRIELPPGKHIVAVRYYMHSSYPSLGISSSVFSIGSKVLSFRAEPGHIYTVLFKVDHLERKWEAWIEDVTKKK